MINYNSISLIREVTDKVQQWLYKRENSHLTAIPTVLDHIRTTTITINENIRIVRKRI